MAATLHGLLATAAENFPDKIAVIGSDSNLTYAELYHSSHALAQTILDLKIKPGSPIGLLLPKSANSIIAVYGIMMAGCCYVPINPFAPSDRVTSIARNVSLEIIIIETNKLKSLTKDLGETTDKLTALTPSEPPKELEGNFTTLHWHTKGDSTRQLPSIDGDQPAYILHTSGSTGLPKGVIISHRNSLTFVNMAAEFFSITCDDRLCSQAPLHFDLSVFDLYVACRQGAAVVIIPEYFSAFPKKMISLIHQHKITVWNSVVSALNLMMERGAPESADFESLRVVIFSGELMPLKYLRLLQENIKNTTFINGYGQTEANTSTYYKIDKIPADDWKIPIGRAFPCYEVFALDNDGRVIDKAGDEGELYVKSEAVAQGYWNNPEATKERFVLDPRSTSNDVRVYRTGDRVRLDINGDFLFVGRQDDMIKSRGYRVELGAIDQTLMLYPGIESAAAIAIPDPLIGNKIIAFISRTSGYDLSESKIIEHCRTQLPTYMVPESINIQTELPRTSTGKVDRQSLKQLTTENY